MAEEQLKIWIDGELYPENNAKISVFDHGLLYGDGIFEGIRAYNGTIFLLEEHLNRLYEGAHYVCLKIPYSKEEIAQHLQNTVKANNISNGYIRLVVTRGKGDLGLGPDKCGKPTVIIIAANIQLYPKELYEKGLEIVSAVTPAIHGEALNPRIKSLNYLNNIMAKMEAMRCGVPEAVMLNHQGFVSECTADNIFIVKDGVLKTPPPSAGILEGCTRNLVLRLAREAGIKTIEENIQRFDLYTADECFLTGTGAEVIAVVKIDGRTIGSGKPDETTLDLMTKFRDYISSIC